MRIFVINPGSTSTKLALYEDGRATVTEEFQHDKTELARFDSVMAQYDFRLDAIRQVVRDNAIDTTTINAIAGRGGLLHPLEGGVYDVSDEMLSDLKSARYGEHPCNLGAVLADALAREWQVPAYIVDPVVTDELMDKARVTGLPEIERRSLFHALNQRGAARTAAARCGVDYESASFIVCHMGGGISIGAHRRGKVVDVINALDGEGPFTPERTGGLPVIPVLEMVEKGEKTPAELKETIQHKGGLYAHLGTNDPREIVRRIAADDARARLVFDSLAYAVAKQIASLAPALTAEDGSLDIASVVLTGGLARSVELVGKIKAMTAFLGPVEVVVGDEEMAALAAGPVRALKGEERAKQYEIL